MQQWRSTMKTEANDLKNDLMTKYLIEIGSSDEQILEGIILNILSNYDYPLEDEGIIMEDTNNVEICEDVADEIIDTAHSNFSTQVEEHYEKALEEKFGDDIETLKSIAFIYYDAYNKRNLEVVANFESTAYEPIIDSLVNGDYTLDEVTLGYFDGDIEPLAMFIESKGHTRTAKLLREYNFREAYNILIEELKNGIETEIET